jgi:hypothetical protein
MKIDGQEKEVERIYLDEARRALSISPGGGSVRSSR